MTNLEYFREIALRKIEGVTFGDFMNANKCIKRRKPYYTCGYRNCNHCWNEWGEREFNPELERELMPVPEPSRKM